MKTRLALYITTYSVKDLLKNNIQLDLLLRFLKDFGFEKVYIENYREGELLDTDVVSRLADIFERDFRVAGGVAIGTWGSGMGDNADWWRVLACVSDDRNIEMFEKAVVQQAQIFDEVIVDDFWANWCYSQRDLENFNKMFGLNFNSSLLLKLLRFDEEIQRMWSIYSRSLLESVSKRIVNKARDVNKGIDIVLKVAEWREEFLHRGLDLYAMSSIFDGIYVGTESREGTYRYGSLFIIDYVRGIVGNKLRGVWFDSYNGLGIPTTIAPEFFVEQLWYSFLGDVDEITFFQGLEYVSRDREEHVELARNVLHNLRKIEDLVTSNRLGLISIALQTAVRKPYDNYIEDVLGLMGIPITVKRYEDIGQNDIVLVREDYVKHIDIARLIDRGVSVFLTASAVEKIVEGALGIDAYDIIGIDRDSPIIERIVEAIGFTDGRSFYSRSHRKQYVYPLGPVLKTSGKVLVHMYAVDRRGRVYPALYEVNHGSASVFVAPITRYPHSFLYHFPEPVRQAVRDIVYRYVGVKIDFRIQQDEETSLQLNQAEVAEVSNTSIIVYNSKSIAIVNNNMHQHYFDIVVDRSKLNIDRIEGSALGNTAIEKIKERENVIRATVKISRHSFDILKYR
ncbi:MAG: hypothetical protein QXY23_06170 [Ignisphaera sp.]